MSEQKLALQSCDQCNKRRVRCSKTLPSCTNCIRREDACTYLRKLKTESYLTDKPYLAERITVFRNSKRRGPKTKNKNALIKMDSIIKETISKIPYIVLQNKEDDWHHLAYRLTLGTPDRNLLNFLIVAFDFPLLSNKLTHWSKAFISVMNEVNPWAQRIILPQAVSFLPIIDELRLSNILNNAVNNYFEYVNPIIPLFTRSGFGSKPRSQILLLAIWVTGLSIDQHIPIIKEIRNFLLHRFTLELRKSYSHPTVDILQAYIISISWRLGYRGKPTNTSILCCIPIHLLHSLGLHQNPPNFLFSRHELIERRLLYSGLIFLDSNWASGNNTPCIVNMDHAETYGDEIKPHEIKFILRSSKSAEEAVYDITLISISKCNYIDCTILQAMRVLRHRIHVKTIESKELLEEVRGLQFKCRTLFLGFIRSMHDLKKVLLEYYKEIDKISPLFERAILSLNMRFRIVFRDITALLLHLRPDLDGLPSRHTAECEGSPFITEAVEAASQVAPIENEFGLMPYHASRPSHLGKTLIMLIKLKHLYRGPIDIKKQIDTILERMAILKTVNSWSSQVTFNLYLADKFNGQTNGRAQL